MNPNFCEHPGPRYIKNICKSCYDETRNPYTDPDIKAQLKADEKEWRIAHSNYRMKENYDLSPEKFQTLLTFQNNACAICKKPKRLVVDHDHQKTRKTGVRGLLCYSCNTMLGKLEKEPNFCQEAQNYLNAPPANILKDTKIEL